MPTVFYIDIIFLPYANPILYRYNIPSLWQSYCLSPQCSYTETEKIRVGKGKIVFQLDVLCDTETVQIHLKNSLKDSCMCIFPLFK